MGAFVYEIPAVLLTAAGCYVDVKTEKIPKWCTVSLFMLSLARHVQGEGVFGLLNAAMGALGFAAVFFFMMQVFKLSLGGGDLKLIFAAGAFSGFKELDILIPTYLFVSSVMELGHFAYIKKSLSPRVFISRFKEERYGVAEPVRKPYGPFIGVPFILFLIISRGGVHVC